MIGRLSKVMRLGLPPLKDMIKMSLLTPATAERINASSLPSGENVGARSRYPGGGEVISRVL